MSSPRRGHQQLDALIKLGQEAGRTLTQPQVDLAHVMATVMVRNRGEHDSHAGLETVTGMTHDHLNEMGEMLEGRGGELDFLYSMALVFAEKELDAPPELSQLKAPRRKPILRTPDQVVRAIASCVTDISSGDVTPQAGRARLYGLQTLLVALRMNNEIAESNTLPELRAAVGADVSRRDLDSELRHLQHMTAEDPG